VDEIGGPVDVVCHSWGAVCALEAARLTHNIARLILYDPVVISTRSPDLPYGLADELDGLIAQDRRDEALSIFYQRAMRMPSELLEQLRADLAWPGRVASARTITREMRAVEVKYRFAWNGAREIHHPMLLVLGELSPPLMHASAAALHAVLPTSRVVVLKGQGMAASGRHPIWSQPRYSTSCDRARPELARDLPQQMPKEAHHVHAA
jgi:pimeloyl-ACP methyl ester carboxylesterase